MFLLSCIERIDHIDDVSYLNFEADCIYFLGGSKQKRLEGNNLFKFLIVSDDEVVC